MKVKNAHKISTIILWICMLITIAAFSIFYSGLLSHPDFLDSWETSALLYWLYILLLLTIAVTGLLALFRFLKRWKEEPQTAWRSLLLFLVLGILFSFTFFLGDGTPLVISGYEGSENTYKWLKIADMWIYSIYTLLGITFVSVFAGILWSYFKKLQ